MKRWIAVGLLMVLALCIWAGAGQASADTSKLEEAKKSVVRIYVDFFTEKGEPTTQFALGSGFLVGDKTSGNVFVVTNRHVVAPTVLQKDGKPQKVNGKEVPLFPVVYIVTTDVSSAIPASITYRNNRADLAILSVDEPITDRQPITLRPFEPYSLESENVIALGFPDIADAYISAARQYQFRSTLDLISVTRGIVSRVLVASNTDRGELIQIDAAVNPGNSGGPLIDENGYLLGVNTYGVADGTYYAVSVNEVISMLNDERVPYLASPSHSTPESTKAQVTAQTAAPTSAPTEAPTSAPTEAPASTPTEAPTPEPVPGQTIDSAILIIAVAAIVVAAALVLIVARSKKKKSEGQKESGGAASAQRMLVGACGVLEGKSYAVKRKTVLGRDPKHCQIRFPNDTPGISGVHCTVRFDGKKVTVVDENSSYGTYVNDTKLIPQQPTVMHRGQTLYLGPKKNGFVLK